MEQKHWRKVANLNVEHVAEDSESCTGIVEVHVDKFWIGKKIIVSDTVLVC